MATSAVMALACLGGCSSGNLDIRREDPIPTEGALILTLKWPPNLSATQRSLPGFTDNVDVRVTGTGPDGEFDKARRITRDEVVNEQVSVIIALPPGTGHVISVIAHDTQGTPIAFGKTTASIRAGANTPTTLELVPLASGDPDGSLPLVASYWGRITAWSGNLKAATDPPPGAVYVDLFGNDGEASVARITYVIHNADELWVLQLAGDLVGLSIDAETRYEDLLRRIPLTSGGVTPYGGFSTQFGGSLETDDLGLSSIEDQVSTGNAAIDLQFPAGLASTVIASGTVIATTGESRRLAGSFECTLAHSGDPSQPPLPTLVDQIGIEITKFSGSFVPSSGVGSRGAEVSVLQLTFTGLNAVIYVDVFDAEVEMGVRPAALTVAAHDDDELWQLRTSGAMGPERVQGSWFAPQQVVDYLPGFTNEIGGYTTDFTGQVLDFSLVTNSIEDPLSEGHGFIFVDIPGAGDPGETVTGQIEATTSTGRTLIGTFEGTIFF